MAEPASSVITKERFLMHRMLKQGQPLSEPERKAALERIASAIEHLQQLADGIARDHACSLDVEAFLQSVRAYAGTADEIAQSYAKGET